MGNICNIHALNPSKTNDLTAFMKPLLSCGKKKSIEVLEKINYVKAKNTEIRIQNTEEEDLEQFMNLISTLLTCWNVWIFSLL